MVIFGPNTACHPFICLSLSPRVFPLPRATTGTTHWACSPGPIIAGSLAPTVTIKSESPAHPHPQQVCPFPPRAQLLAPFLSLHTARHVELVTAGQTTRSPVLISYKLKPC